LAPSSRPTRITHGEEIPRPSLPQPGQHLVSPDPTIALKVALHMALYQRDMTVADLADLMGFPDWHQAERLVDPRHSTKLVRLAGALGALGYRIMIAVEDEAARSECSGRPAKRRARKT
jgi:antitoxin HicB